MYCGYLEDVKEEIYRLRARVDAERLRSGEHGDQAK